MNKKHVFIMKPNLKDTKIETMIVSIMQGYHYEIKYTKYSRHAKKLRKNVITAEFMQLVVMV